VAEELGVSIPSNPDDPASWGVTGRVQRTGNGNRPLIASRVPPVVKTNWSAVVEEIAAKTGLKTGDVAAIGYITAIQRQEEWEEMARRVPPRSP